MDKQAVEDQVKQVWAEVLPIKQFDQGADFFELGGNSLKLITILDKFQKHPEFSKIKNLGIVDLFDRPELGELTEYLFTELQKSE